MSWTRLTLSLMGRSIRNPAVGMALIRVAWRFRQRGWYTRFPFLPLPAKPYFRWRMHTAYGRDDAIPSAHEVVRYARWATREP